MTREPPRLARERRTVRLMVKLYCRHHHGTRGGLCSECGELAAYAMLRLDQCPFQAGKTACAKCSVHCYQAEMREKIRQVMRYAGPRMIWRHPILAIGHMIDGRREEPIRPAEKRKAGKG